MEFELWTKLCDMFLIEGLLEGGHLLVPGLLDPNNDTDTVLIKSFLAH